MRLAVFALVAAGGLGLSLILGWSWMASLPETAAEPQPWQRRELLFLKGAYDRTQDDLSRQPQPSASLQAEQERIVRQMAETARLLPPDAVPADIAELLAAAAAPPPAAPETSLSQLIETVMSDTEELPDLRVGLGDTPLALADFAGLAVDPQLRQPLAPPAAPRKAPAAAAAKPR